MVVGGAENRVLHAMAIDDAYRVERVLASGPGGSTELVTMEDSGPYLRKRMPLQRANRPVWAALAACNCPRLPQVVATYETPDEFVAVYDYVPGDTLASVVTARGALSAVAAARIIREVCEAVAELHSCGVVHCDITPENVVMAADGAHVIDLGIARMAQQQPECSEPPLGTWGFAAPEQYGFAPCDERADGYAVGRLLGFLLTGVEPDSEDYRQALADEERVPAPLRDVVLRASAFEPSARYQTMDALAVATVQATEESGTPPGIREDRNAGIPPTGTPGESQPRRDGRDCPSRRRPMRILGIVACAAVLLVAGCIAASYLESHVASVLADAMASRPDAGDRSGDGRSLSDTGTDAPLDSDALGVGTSAVEGSEGGELPGGIAASEALSDILSVPEYAWFVDRGGYVWYVYGIRNESERAAVQFPAVNIVGRDAEGRLLSSDEHVIGWLQPGETHYFASIAGNGEAPHSVEISPQSPMEYQTTAPFDDGAVFDVRDLREVSDGFGGSNFVGQVSLESGSYRQALSGEVAVTVVLRDAEGQLVGGATGYAPCPQPGSPSAFEVMGGDFPAYATLEAHVQEW